VFERFTDRSRRVLVLAQEEARHLGHAHIGSEDILLGLSAEGAGIAARVLQDQGITTQDLREQIRKTPIGGSKKKRSPPFTSDAQKLLQLSLLEALQLGHNHIGTEHILLAIIKNEGGAQTMLLKVGADPTEIRNATLALIQSNQRGPHDQAPEAPRASPSSRSSGSFRSVSGTCP
jgi:ATP-dependent Clp protease ATP-binding subunit ClpC